MFRLGLLFCASFVLQACTNNSTPTINSLSDIYEISLSNSVTNYTSLSTVTINGICGKGVTEIDDSLDNGNTWQNVSSNSLSANLNCQQGQTFSINFNLSSSTLLPWTGTPTGNYYILLRSKGISGYNASQNAILAQTAVNTGQVVTSLSASSNATGSTVGAVSKIFVSGAYQHGTTVDAQMRVR